MRTISNDAFYEQDMGRHRVVLVLGGYTDAFFFLFFVNLPKE